MKKLLLILALLLLPSFAWAQCTGIFQPNTLCGNLGAQPAPPSAFTASGTVVGPGPTVVGTIAGWANTSGTQLETITLGGVGGYFDTQCSSAVGEGWVRTSNNGWSCQYIGYQDPAWYGADPTGVADSTAAVKAAEAALPSTGGNVTFNTCGTYKVSSSIPIGNGTSSTASTVYGIYINGVAGSPGNWLFTGFAGGPCVKINWTGGAAPVFQVLGPLQGWGFNNLWIEGNSTATSCINVVSAMFGNSSNLELDNCTVAGLFSASVPVFAGMNVTDSFENVYQNVRVLVPNVNSATGVTLTGDTVGATSNTDYNTFTNLFIITPQTSNNFSGLELAICDSNTFYNLKVLIQGTGTNGVNFFYNTGFPQFPASNTIFSLDSSGSAGTQIQDTGAPGATAKPNYIYGLIETNGGAPVALANLTIYSSHSILLAPGGPSAPSTGLNCSGTPTSSFASTFGLVTHC